MAAGSAITAAEIFFEHDAASFGDRWMWAPVAIGPVGVAAGIAGAISARMAKTALPLASWAIVANGIQGLNFHLLRTNQKPGGWKYALFQIEFAPTRLGLP